MYQAELFSNPPNGYIDNCNNGYSIFGGFGNFLASSTVSKTFTKSTVHCKTLILILFIKQCLPKYNIQFIFLILEILMNIFTFMQMEF